MKRKLSAAVAALTVTAMCLTGCGSQNTQGDVKSSENSVSSSSTADVSSSATESSQTDSTDPVTLRFAWWGSDGRHEAILKAIEIYQEKHPNVTIEAEYSGYDGYYEKMMTTLSSGTAPDLFQFMRGWVPDVQTAQHYLADIDSLPIDTSTLEDGLMEGSGSYKGEAVMVPVSVGGAAAYVNSEFAENNGIDTSKLYTWDEIKELGKTIHEKDADSYLLTADIDVLNYMFLEPYIVQITGKPLFDEDTYEPNFTQEDLQASIQNIMDLYEAGAIEPFDESAAFVGQMNQNVRWINGKIGMVFDYTSTFAKYAGTTTGDIAAMQIPQIANAKCSGVAYGGDRGISINDNSANKEEAAKFLDFLLNDPDAINALGTNLGFCPTSVSQATLIDSGIVDAVQVEAVNLSAKNSYTQNSLGTNTSLLTTRKDILQEIIYKDITVEQGAAEIYEDSLATLEELKNNQ